MRDATPKVFDAGVFTISLDFELAWGSFDSGHHLSYIEHSRRRGESVYATSRRIIDRLLELFHRYDLPVTWATVGHLFLDRCEPIDGVKHPDLPRAKHAWFPRDWFALDPCGDCHSDPLWYGRDLVEKIIAATPKHDVGSHSFSHVIFDDPGCTAEVAEAELRKCVELASAMGVTMKSFVFPRNRVAHTDLLRKFGFTVTRGAAPFWYLRLPNRTSRRVAHVLDDVLAVSPQCGLPRRENGLWVLPASMFLQSMDGVRRFLPVKSRVTKAIRGIDRAVESRTLFHLIFHPINMYVRPDAMFAALEGILEHAALRRQRGDLAFMTMAQVASHCQARLGGNNSS